MSVKPLKMSDLAPSNPFLTEDEKETLKAKQRALDQLLSDKDIAKFKIEILLGKGFAPSKPSHGAMSFWENGSKLHGGGDTIMHICPACSAFIPDSSHGLGFLVCAQCGKNWQGEQVHGQLLFRLTAQGWAQVVLKYFLKLEMKADIYVKHHPDDIRSTALLEQDKQHMGDLLMNSRRSRKPRIYPLKNIIKDTSAGADLEGRFLAFLRA